MVSDPSAITSDEVIEMLGLVPLPREGGMWSQIWIDDRSTAIYYLLTADDFSAMHRLRGLEIYHHYMGAPVQMLLLLPDGQIACPMLGTDLQAGHRPAIKVPGGVWQGCQSAGGWSLLGTTMVPPFNAAEFELGDRDHLMRQYPEAGSAISLLTR